MAAGRAGLRGPIRDRLTLRVDDKVFGALTLYAVEPDAFDEEETKLLMEVAADLAFGIEVLRTRAARSQANKELRRLAYTDDVTGLPNRTHLLELLDAAFARQQDGALLFIALEHFKEIIDTQGYLVGDAVLKAAGERLASILQTGDLLARIGDGNSRWLCRGATWQRRQELPQPCLKS